MADDDLVPYSRYPEGTTLWIGERTETHITPPYQIRLPNGDAVVEGNDYYRIADYGAIVDRYGDVTETDERTLVPVEVAVDGKPALAMYLYAVLGWSREEISEEMGVKDESVRKYLQRFRPRRKGVD